MTTRIAKSLVGGTMSDLEFEGVLRRAREHSRHVQSAGVCVVPLICFHAVQPTLRLIGT